MLLECGGAPLLQQSLPGNHVVGRPAFLSAAGPGTLPIERLLQGTRRSPLCKRVRASAVVVPVRIA